MTHLPAWAALGLAVEVDVCTGECEGGLCDGEDGGHGRGRADEV